MFEFYPLSYLNNKFYIKKIDRAGENEGSINYMQYYIEQIHSLTEMLTESRYLFLLCFFYIFISNIKITADIW